MRECCDAKAEELGRLRSQQARVLKIVLGMDSIMWIVVPLAALRPRTMRSGTRVPRGIPLPKRQAISCSLLLSEFRRYLRLPEQSRHLTGCIKRRGQLCPLA